MKFFLVMCFTYGLMFIAAHHSKEREKREEIYKKEKEREDRYY